MLKQISRLQYWGILALILLMNPVGALAQVRGGVDLIQPLDDSTASLASSPTIFLNYFNVSVGWIFRVAVGFTVVWVLIGGVMFMTSGNNQGRRSEAISRMTWAIVGLLVLLFAGVILRALNSVFYVA